MDASQACARCQSKNDLKRCARCESTSYCSSDIQSKECQTAHWKTHKRSCEPLSGSNAPQNVSRGPTSESKAKVQDGRNPNISQTRYITAPASRSPVSQTSTSTSTQIWGVKLHSSGTSFTFIGPEARFVPEFFDPGHPIFYAGELCPFTALYSIPIILYSPTMARREDHISGNQPAVYLRIEPENGFAPSHWQMFNPGPCYAVRQDRKPLGTELLETMYEFHSSLLSSVYFEKTMEFGRPPYRITPEVFKRFSDKYWKEQKKLGRIPLSSVDGSEGS